LLPEFALVKILTQESDEAMIYLSNKNKNSYMSIAKSKNIIVLALTQELVILALLFGDFGMKSY
jgi:hypothetical protein